MKRVFSIGLVCVLAVGLGVGAYAQEVPTSYRMASELSGAEVKTPFFLDFGLRKYFNSFTSYQFPDPVTGTDPLSRLEWPWDQWFGVIRAGSVFDSVSVKGEFATTLIPFSQRKAQDSDWTLPALPWQKTIFSEGQARPRSMLLDFNLAVPFSRSPSLKGVLGYRKQILRFSYADVLQTSLLAPPIYIPDEGITFSQAYTHYYGGGIFGTAVDLGLIGDIALPVLLVELQADYAYVRAGNADQHHIRPAIQQPRWTLETTTGNAWHVRLTLGCLLNDSLSVNIEGDFIRITTTGDHRLTAGAIIDAGWDGVKVWSDQQYLQFNGIMRF